MSSLHLSSNSSFVRDVSLEPQVKKPDVQVNFNYRGGLAQNRWDWPQELSSRWD